MFILTISFGRFVFSFPFPLFLRGCLIVLLLGFFFLC